jgi:hypothetical protein
VKVWAITLHYNSLEACVLRNEAALGLVKVDDFPDGVEVLGMWVVRT